jgi:hypothetical protein
MPLKESFGRTYKTLDITYGYDLNHVKTLFEMFGVEGRTAYWEIETEVDMIYPFLYNGLLMVFLYLLLKRIRPNWIRLCYLPLVSLMCDLGENITVLSMLWVKPFYIMNWQVVVASCFTVIKTTIALGCTFLVMLLSIGLMFASIKNLLKES